jgi:hypothetical protein
MWVKRTESEITEERRQQRQNRLRSAVVFGVLVTIFTTCFFGREEAGRRGGRFTVPAYELPQRLHFSIPCGVLVAFLFPMFGRKRPVMICPKCEVTKYDDSVAGCSCGGHFEKIEEMKYVN